LLAYGYKLSALECTFSGRIARTKWGFMLWLRGERMGSTMNKLTEQLDEIIEGKKVKLSKAQEALIERAKGNDWLVCYKCPIGEKWSTIDALIKKGVLSNTPYSRTYEVKPEYRY
jgi:hypothetical protein